MKKKTIQTQNFYAGILPAILIIGLVSITSCMKVDPPEERTDGWCALPLASGDTARGLGPMDYNAGYNGFLAPMKPGEYAVLHAHFPHSRYASVMVYDEHFLLLDTILDKDIQPLAGENPFWPGVDRSADDLGEFEIKIRMEPRPAGEREPNTLYAGIGSDGKPNPVAVVGYRVYLPDAGMTFKDRHPLAVYGGVPAPKFRIIGREGTARCPNPRESKLAFYRVFGDLLLTNWKNILDPAMGIGEYASPPIWVNNASKESQSELTFVPCPDANYLMTPISRKYGELLVFRFQQARIPTQTFHGRPFPEPKDYDIRYWSISFDYFDRTRPEQVFGEKTVADLEVPLLPDGASQIVVGFGGMERPAAVPPEQWVGLELEKGLAVVRNIVVNPDYPGYFWKLPPGPVPLEYDRYTPGGVYCSVEEFTKNSEIGLKRQELLKK